MPRFHLHRQWLFAAITCCPLLTLLALPCPAQIKVDTSAAAQRFGPGQIVRYRVGASITASKGPVHDVYAMVAIPFECDEQSVNKVEEDISQEVAAVEYRSIQGGATQMLISIPYLAGRQEAHAILTFDVETKVILPPEEEFTSQLVLPDASDREVKYYLGNSPYIQAKSSLIRRELRDIFAEKKPDDKSTTERATTDEEGDDATQDPNVIEDLLPADEDDADSDAQARDETTKSAPASPAELTPWQRVERIYDHVLQKIEYREGDDQSALEVLKSGIGDCHDISALFIALCRADKVPARMVWVHEHQYPEFCLADPEGNLHWFPCESSGLRAFGEMPITRVIMQKGDNFKVKERPRERLRYASDYLTGVPVPGSGKPSVRYIREQL